MAGLQVSDRMTSVGVWPCYCSGSATEAQGVSQCHSSSKIGRTDGKWPDVMMAEVEGMEKGWSAGGRIICLVQICGSNKGLCHGTVCQQ
jgi:hypothetical protein